LPYGGAREVQMLQFVQVEYIVLCILISSGSRVVTLGLNRLNMGAAGVRGLCRSSFF
jgi:hypothetical protein